jgi:hypothetical protein
MSFVFLPFQGANARHLVHSEQRSSLLNGEGEVLSDVEKLMTGSVD